MTFTQPEWFFLLPLFVAVGLAWKSLRLWKPLRIAILAFGTLLLVDPQTDKRQDALELWVLLDRSESTDDLIDQGLPEWLKLLEQARTTRHDTLHLIDYASEVVEQKPGTETAVYTGNRKLTRTRLALQNVLSLTPENRPSRVLIFTDGYSTEPLADVAAKLTREGVPVDFRLIREETDQDCRIARLHLPLRSQVGEPFTIGITLRGHSDTRVPLIIKRNGRTLSETEVSIVNGTGQIEFSDRIPRSGSYKYSAEILPEVDAHPGNNHAKRWIEVVGGPRVLIVTKYLNDPLAEALKDQDYEVQVVTDPSQLHVGQLTGARSVVLNNVPSFEIPSDFLQALNFYVREQGGGLMMVGGKQSFGSGGYFQSAVDELLPVSMELKNEHRKLSVAMAIVMDRSGSMAMSAGGGKTKMNLANTGAARAVELLGGQDQVTVFAVDSHAHRIVPLVNVTQHKKSIIGKIRKVKSQGGGIFVYTGLKAAWKELQKSPAGTRHIILFSDAADSEEPGKYKQLLAEMTSKGATVSVIGLGTAKDSDAAFLQDIAKLGKGRCFFTRRPADIPRLFAQETVTVARSSYITDPVGTHPTGQWSEISAKPFSWLTMADGYNLSYARDDSTTSLASTDEYRAPLVSHAQRGIGRTAAVSFPLGGKHSEKVRAWPQYGDFIQTLTQWLMGDSLPPGIGIRHQLKGTELSIDLLYDTELWAEPFAIHPPRIRLLNGQTQQPDSDSGLGHRSTFELPWERIAPGRFSISRELEEGALVRGVIQTGRHAIPFGPIMIGSSTEWAFEPDSIAELRSVSAQTGGRELTDLSQAWLRPSVVHSTRLRIPLAIAIMLLLLIDTLITRTGWKLPQLGLLQKIQAGVRNTVTTTAPPSKRPARDEQSATPKKPLAGTSEPRPSVKPPIKNKPPGDHAEGGQTRSSRFDRAKRRK